MLNCFPWDQTLKNIADLLLLLLVFLYFAWNRNILIFAKQRKKVKHII